MHQFLATLLVASFFVINALQERGYRRRGVDARGVVPIAPRVFALGKLSVVLSWLCIVVQAYFRDLRVIEAGAPVSWLAVGVEALGILTIAFGYAHLGDNNQMGLGKPPIALRTRGLYRVSRNPIYVGFHLMTLSAVLYTLNPIVLLFGSISVGVHHAVVLAEEAHLERELGDAYREYRQRVRRYV